MGSVVVKRVRVGVYLVGEKLRAVHTVVACGVSGKMSRSSYVPIPPPFEYIVAYTINLATEIR